MNWITVGTMIVCGGAGLCIVVFIVDLYRIARGKKTWFLP